MQVKLKVLGGGSAGRELPVPGPKFLIGRGEDCQLRPRSELISRHHCLLTLNDSNVTLRDFGSKNGTFVNGDPVKDECDLKMGDLLKVGPLEFELLIDLGLAGAKRPKVKDIKDVVNRAFVAQVDDDDVSKWLEEADEKDRVRRGDSTETREFKLDHTEQILVKNPAEAEEITATAKEEEPAEKTKRGHAKKEPGKLPPVPKDNPKNTQDAATDMLRKFFNRG